MKYPLRLVIGPRDLRIADANGMIVCRPCQMAWFVMKPKGEKYELVSKQI
jgi:hypothetical protein